MGTGLRITSFLRKGLRKKVSSSSSSSVSSSSSASSSDVEDSSRGKYAVVSERLLQNKDKASAPVRKLKSRETESSSEEEQQEIQEQQ